MIERYREKFGKDKIDVQSSDIVLKAINGQNLTVVGVVELEVKFGNSNSELQRVEDKVEFVVVKESKRWPLLGTETMKKFCFNIDFEKEKIRFPNKVEIPMKIRNQNGVIEAMITETIELLPKEIRMITIAVPEARIDQKQIYYVMDVEENEEVRVRVREGLVEIGQGEARIQLYNPSVLPGKIQEGSIIALVNSVRSDQISNKEVDKINFVRIEDNRLQEERRKETIKKIDQLELKGFLSKEDRSRVRELLKEFVNLFAVHHKAPPVTANTRHRINTGDHPPIKLRSKRMSPAKKEIVKRSRRNVEILDHQDFRQPMECTSSASREERRLNSILC